MQLTDLGESFMSMLRRNPNLLYALKFIKEAGEVNSRITLDKLPRGQNLHAANGQPDALSSPLDYLRVRE